MKKRINDLSILKSSNNTIMNQKLAQLMEENAKLKKDIDILQNKKGGIIQE
jgi:PHD/YefM family antitoxin component YafN of YafNO toxin-antitoxin module